MKKTNKRGNTCIYVGIRKRAVVAAGEVIMDILSCDSADQDTMRSALTAFTSALSINNTVISNNSITQEISSEIEVPLELVEDA